MYILGLTTLGDSAASIIKDGILIAAAEEERFRRIKHYSGFPFKAVEYCLSQADVTIKDIDHIALYWKPWVLRHKCLQAVRSLTISLDMFKARVDRGISQVSKSYLGMLGIPQLLRRHFGPSKFRFHYVDHHTCHAASAFFVSPFETAAILTMDGTGEDTTTMAARGNANVITPLQRVKLPHSLGQFYSAVTNFLGFDMFAGDEWKVMGLAAYGEPCYYDFFARRVISANGPLKFKVNIRVLDHHLAKTLRFSPELVGVLGPPRQPGEPIEGRHQNIASSAQRILEDVVLRLVSTLHRDTREENLCLAGGVAFNSVMNGRIARESEFRNVFIQPAAGDAGCSLGAAYVIHHRCAPHASRNFVMQHAYYGPGFTSAECAAALKAAGISFRHLPDEELLPAVAELIAKGGVVAWFQGRMEFGPRALGNRSFLADPRRADMRLLLNSKIKMREWFRPLAPSIHQEATERFFGRKYHDPFMVTVINVREEQKASIPAVVHVDGSARPQTVSKDINPRYWRLIEEFERLTGVPALLNTSFNIQEPIVCRPEDAIKTYMSSGCDVLVLENNLVEKASPQSIDQMRD